ncbi:MAG: DNA-3-methyladenine glycosylase [Bacteroidota bacterium]
MQKLTTDFYLSTDIVQHAKSLLGKLLITNFDHRQTIGRIVETEAYRAPDDKACHAYGNKKTKRTKVMFMQGGTAYITLCYGIHHLFNVVTAPEGMAQAVLIRALAPMEGIDHMLARRKMQKLERRLTAGPGALSQAMGISTDYHGSSLTEENSLIYLADDGCSYEADEIIASPRVGIAYAEEWVEVAWRFRVKDSPWTSKAK